MKRETRKAFKRECGLHYSGPYVTVTKEHLLDALATDAEVKRLKKALRDEQGREHATICGEGCSPRCLRLTAALKPRKAKRHG